MYQPINTVAIRTAARAKVQAQAVINAKAKAKRARQAEEAAQRSNASTTLGSLGMSKMNMRSNLPKTLEKYVRLWVQSNHRSPLDLRALTTRAKALGCRLPQRHRILQILFNALDNFHTRRSSLFQSVQTVRTAGPGYALMYIKHQH